MGSRKSPKSYWSGQRLSFSWKMSQELLQYSRRLSVRFCWWEEEVMSIYWLYSEWMPKFLTLTTCICWFCFL